MCFGSETGLALDWETRLLWVESRLLTREIQLCFYKSFFSALSEEPKALSHPSGRWCCVGSSRATYFSWFPARERGQPVES